MCREGLSKYHQVTVEYRCLLEVFEKGRFHLDAGQGPKNVKMFINLPRSMDFEEAERSEPTQALELTPEDIKEESIIQLRYVKFQNVQSVTVSTKPAPFHLPN